MAVSINGSGSLTGVTAVSSTTYGTTAPSSPVTGQVWVDTNTTPPTGKVYSGSAWVSFSKASVADFSNTATGTYTSSGINYKYVAFTSTGTLTITRSGDVDVLVVGAGTGGNDAPNPRGGQTIERTYYLSAGTYTATVGSGGAPGSSGGASYLDLIGANGGAWGGTNYGIVNSSITGTSLAYGGTAWPIRANSGQGAFTGGATGAAGIVVVRVQV